MVEPPTSEQLQTIRDADTMAGTNLQMAPRAWLDRRQLLALVDAQEEVLADKRRLTRELDVLLNGTGAAQAPSLCDIVSQVQRWVRKYGPVVDMIDLADRYTLPPMPENVAQAIADQIQEKP